MMKQICIYGKGGIGKSTTVQNLAAAMALDGKKAAVVGCDPKADSTRNLTRKRVRPVLECVLNNEDDFYEYGFGGILCMESGGPEPGTGCAGRGIVTALEAIRGRNLLYDRDVVIYDVLGDVVCGGFSAPMRERVADQVYLVTTDDYMAIYAANNICKGIRRFAKTGDIRLAGVIRNGRSSMEGAHAVEEFAERVGSRVVGSFPMSREISLAEISHRTVVEAFPDSEISACFREMAKEILKNEGGVIPEPMTEEELEALYRRILKC